MGTWEEIAFPAVGCQPLQEDPWPAFGHHEPLACTPLIFCYESTK